MKTVTNHILHNKKYIEPFHFRIQETRNDVEIVDYVEDKGKLIITLFSILFSEDKFRFFIQDNKLVIVITEKVQPGLQDVPVMDWHRFNGRPYERLRNVSIYLPGDNFYLKRHFLIPEQYLLKIILGQIADN